MSELLMNPKRTEYGFNSVPSRLGRGRGGHRCRQARRPSRIVWCLHL